MVHGDDKGLVLPPGVAQIQVSEASQRVVSVSWSWCTVTIRDWCCHLVWHRYRSVKQHLWAYISNPFLDSAIECKFVRFPEINYKKKKIYVAVMI